MTAVKTGEALLDAVENFAGQNFHGHRQ